MARHRLSFESQTDKYSVQASQIAIALLGITYNINPADKYTITRPGLVAVADLRDIQGPRVLAGGKRLNSSEEINSRRYSANSFGQIGGGFGAELLETYEHPGRCTILTWHRPTLRHRRQTSKRIQRMTATITMMMATAMRVTAVAMTKKSPSHSRLVAHSHTQPSSSKRQYLHDPKDEGNDAWSRVHAFEPSDTNPWSTPATPPSSRSQMPF